MGTIGAQGGRWGLMPSLRGYRAAMLPKDVSAGVAIAAVGLPSAIAYPAIAGLPPATGLYASIAPLVAYAVFGPSPRLIVGPDAATMTMLAGSMAAVLAASPPGTDPVAVASLIALGVGAICLAARLLRLGVVANFLSRPILTGFFAGISLAIIVGQISRFTSVKPEAGGIVLPFLELVGRLGEVHLPSFILAGTTLALILALKALRSPVPGPIVAVVLSVVLSAALDLRSFGIATVGEVPRTLPAFSLPDPAGLPISQIVLGAAAVFLVSFGAGIITAKSFGAMEGRTVDPDRELGGFAAANAAAGLFGAFPVTSSDSRTAINFAVGGQSQIASVVAALTLVVTILYLGPALAILPVPVLGAILVGAAIGLIDIGALRHLWHTSRIEFVFALIALWGPVWLGVLQGIVIAIAATLVYILVKVMQPRDAQLGVIPGREGFYKLHRHPEARPCPGLCLVVVQGSILFLNADYVRARLNAIAAEQPEGTRWLVIDAGAIPQTDASAAEMLGDLAGDLEARGMRLGLAEMHAEVRALLDRAGVLDRIGRDMVFEDLSDAVADGRAQATTQAQQ